MKFRYLIPLLLVASFLLMLVHIVLLGFTTSLSYYFIEYEYGAGNIIIIRAIAVVTSFVVGTLALPLGYLARNRRPMYGLALPILGFILIFAPPHEQGEATLLRVLAPEYLTYILSCWGFWVLGHIAYRKAAKAQPGSGLNEMG